MPVSARTHAAILRKVSARAVADAREAWRMARKFPSERYVRAAFRACVFAARALRKAADPDDEADEEMLSEATSIETTAEALKLQLVRIVEGEIPPDTGT